MRTLEVFSAYSHSLKSVRNNFGFAFRVSWPWMLALLPFNIAANMYVLLNRAADVKKVQPDVLAVSIGIGLLSAIAFASIAVMWHRFILLDEVPQGWARLRLDRTVWRYYGNSILIILMGFAAGLPFGIFFGLLQAVLGKSSVIILIPIAIFFMFALISYAFRVGIKLPSVAIGRSDYSFRDAMGDSQGNFWRFVGLALLIAITLIGAALMMALLVYLLASTGSQPILFVTIAVQLFVNWLSTIWNVTILTSLYGYFAEKRSF